MPQTVVFKKSQKINGKAYKEGDTASLSNTLFDELAGKEIVAVKTKSDKKLESKEA